MTRRRTSLYLFLALALSAFFWECSGPDYAGGSEVVGYTVAKSGDPVPNAEVKAYKQVTATYQLVDSVESNAKGQFVFKNLPEGMYKLIAVAKLGDTTLVGLKSDIVNDRIAKPGEQPVRVNAGNMEMLPEGKIAGSVFIDKDDNTGVLCYTLDSAFMAVSKADGSYTIPRVAEGTYTVCFFLSGYEPYKIPGVVVKRGEVTHLDPVYLQLDRTKPPNPPRNASGSYDTVHGVVHLNWNQVPVKDLLGYIVYRKEASDIGGGLPIDTIIHDTVAVDTVMDALDTATKYFVYYVTAIDSLFDESSPSNSVSIPAIPPSSVRPVVRSMSADTAVEYGGSVRSRITFINAFNNYQVYLMQGKDSPWVPVSHSTEGITDTLFSTGANSSWGKVSFRIKYSTDSLDTFFTVHVKPRGVAIVSADSTDSTITLRWNRSQDSDFKEYSVHRKAVTDTVIFHSTKLTDTAYTYPTLSMTRADYWIAVADTEGEVSTFDSTLVKHLRIVNTPPRFTTTTLPDSIQVGTEYKVTLTASDRNNDDMSFTLVSPVDGRINNTTFTWTPGVDQGGVQRCTVTVKDMYGGLDTLAWTIQVVAHGIWAETDSLNGARRQCGIAAVNGVIYAVGGSINKVNSALPIALKTVEAYDTSKKVWETKQALQNARWAPFVGSWNGKLYVMGGFSERSYSIATIEEYDPIADSWTTLGQTMPCPRANGASCVIGNNFYCIGGKTYDTAQRSEVIVKSIDVFDLSTKTWSKGPNMLYARADHQAQVFNNQIWIIGGYGGKTDSIDVANNEEIMVTAVESCNLTRCDSSASLHVPRCNFGSALLGNTLFCIGGFMSLTLGDDAVLSSVEMLNLGTRTGTTGVPLPGARHSAAAIGIQGRIYCVGGIVGTITTRSVIVYYP